MKRGTVQTKKHLLLLIVAFTQLLNLASAADISCPVLLCEEQDRDKEVKSDVCYRHDKQQPTRYMRMHTCEWYQLWGISLMNGPASCELDLQRDLWAWPNEEQQHFGTKDQPSSTNQEDSTLYGKRTEAYCRYIADYQFQLNNGRSCQKSYECKSQKCLSGRCLGLRSGEFCYDHADCDTGMFCLQGSRWPWSYQCTKLRSNFENCNATVECQTDNFCWYRSATDKTNALKSCLPMYSQDFGIQFGWENINTVPNIDDSKFNGQYCKSGMAFQDASNPALATCTQTNHVNFGDQLTSFPYMCDPVNNAVKCNLFYNTTLYDPKVATEQTSVSTPCKCALDGDNGFCGSVLGTDTYADAMASLRPVLRLSECHTLDRDNMRAQRDSCGIKNIDMWKDMVAKTFNIRYWSYVNADKNVKDCIEKNFADSLTNLSRNQAIGGFYAVSITFAAVTSLVFVY